MRRGFPTNGQLQITLTDDGIGYHLGLVTRVGDPPRISIVVEYGYGYRLTTQPTARSNVQGQAYQNPNY